MFNVFTKIDFLFVSLIWNFYIVKIKLIFFRLLVVDNSTWFFPNLLSLSCCVILCFSHCEISRYTRLHTPNTVARKHCWPKDLVFCTLFKKIYMHYSKYVLDLAIFVSGKSMKTETIRSVILSIWENFIVNCEKLKRKVHGNPWNNKRYVLIIMVYMKSSLQINLIIEIVILLVLDERYFL